jgi:hypothetical protein
MPRGSGGGMPGGGGGGMPGGGGGGIRDGGGGRVEGGVYRGGPDLSESCCMCLAEGRQPIAQSPRVVGPQSAYPRVSGRSRCVEFDVDEAEGAFDRACCHVDELHPAVGHDDEGAEECAMNHEQVIIAFGVAPRTPVATDHPPRPPEDDDRSHTGTQRGRGVDTLQSDGQ